MATTYIYYGPSPERPFCEVLLDKTFTRAMIAHLNNAFPAPWGPGAPVNRKHLGGNNCRHKWMKVAGRKEPTGTDADVQAANAAAAQWIKPKGKKKLSQEEGHYCMSEQPTIKDFIAAVEAGIAPPKSQSNLYLGSPFRVLTAGTTVRHSGSGDEIVSIDLDLLEEMVSTFSARIAAGDGPPRIDLDHKPGDGLFGEIVALSIQHDERGPGLYVTPAWRLSILSLAEKFGIEEKMLWNSPEIIIGDRYARSGDSPKLLGKAELVGLAVTVRPAQSESLIDPIVLCAPAFSGVFQGGASMAQKYKLAADEEHGLPTGEDAPQSDAKDEQIKALEDALAAAKARIEELEAELVKAKADKAEAETEAEEAAEAALSARESQAVAHLFSAGLPRSKEQQARKAWRIEHDPKLASAKAALGGVSFWASLSAEAEKSAKLTGDTLTGVARPDVGTAKPKTFTAKFEAFALSQGYDLNTPSQRSLALTAFGKAHPEEF